MNVAGPFVGVKMESNGRPGDIVDERSSAASQTDCTIAESASGDVLVRSEMLTVK